MNVAPLATLAALRGAPSPARPATARAVLAAVAADERIATAALWRDRVPAGATDVVGGPALVSMRAAAAARSAAGLRIRLVSSTTEVLSLQIADDGRRATVVLRWSQRLLPEMNGGRGRPIELVEEATLALRRLPASSGFTVWSVQEIP